MNPKHLPTIPFLFTLRKLRLILNLSLTKVKDLAKRLIKQLTNHYPLSTNHPPTHQLINSNQPTNQSTNHSSIHQLIHPSTHHLSVILSNAKNLVKRPYTSTLKLLTFNLSLLTFLFVFSSPTFALCDGWAETFSVHRNAGNGCTYQCTNSGQWSAPLSCDGQGNGTFQTAQGQQTNTNQAAIDAAIAQREAEAAAQLARQTAAQTAALAAASAAQRAAEAQVQMDMLQRQTDALLSVAQTDEEKQAIIADQQEKQQNVATASGVDLNTLLTGTNSGGTSGGGSSLPDRGICGTKDGEDFCFWVYGDNTIDWILSECERRGLDNCNQGNLTVQDYFGNQAALPSTGLIGNYSPLVVETQEKLAASNSQVDQTRAARSQCDSAGNRDCTAQERAYQDALAAQRELISSTTLGTCRGSTPECNVANQTVEDNKNRYQQEYLDQISALEEEIASIRVTCGTTGAIDFSCQQRQEEAEAQIDAIGAEIREISDNSVYCNSHGVNCQEDRSRLYTYKKDEIDYNRQTQALQEQYLNLQVSGASQQEINTIVNQFNDFNELPFCTQYPDSVDCNQYRDTILTSSVQARMNELQNSIVNADDCTSDTGDLDIQCSKQVADQVQAWGNELQALKDSSYCQLHEGCDEVGTRDTLTYISQLNTLQTQLDNAIQDCSENFSGDQFECNQHISQITQQKNDLTNSQYCQDHVAICQSNINTKTQQFEETLDVIDYNRRVDDATSRALQAQQKLAIDCEHESTRQKIDQCIQQAQNSLNIAQSQIQELAEDVQACTASAQTCNQMKSSLKNSLSSQLSTLEQQLINTTRGCQQTSGFQNITCEADIDSLTQAIDQLIQDHPFCFTLGSNCTDLRTDTYFQARDQVNFTTQLNQLENKLINQVRQCNQTPTTFSGNIDITFSDACQNKIDQATQAIDQLIQDSQYCQSTDVNCDTVRSQTYFQARDELNYKEQVKDLELEILTLYQGCHGYDLTSGANADALDIDFTCLKSVEPQVQALEAQIDTNIRNLNQCQGANLQVCKQSLTQAIQNELGAQAVANVTLSREALKYQQDLTQLQTQLIDLRNQCTQNGEVDFECLKNIEGQVQIVEDQINTLSNTSYYCQNQQTGTSCRDQSSQAFIDLGYQRSFQQQLSQLESELVQATRNCQSAFNQSGTINFTAQNDCQNKIDDLTTNIDLLINNHDFCTRSGLDCSQARTQAYFDARDQANFQQKVIDLETEATTLARQCGTGDVDTIDTFCLNSVTSRIKEIEDEITRIMGLDPYCQDHYQQCLQIRKTTTNQLGVQIQQQLDAARTQEIFEARAANINQLSQEYQQARIDCSKNLYDNPNACVEIWDKFEEIQKQTDLSLNDSQLCKQNPDQCEESLNQVSYLGQISAIQQEFQNVALTCYQNPTPECEQEIEDTIALIDTLNRESQYCNQQDNTCQDTAEYFEYIVNISLLNSALEQRNNALLSDACIDNFSGDDSECNAASLDQRNQLEEQISQIFSSRFCSASQTNLDTCLDSIDQLRADSNTLLREKEQLATFQRQAENNLIETISFTTQLNQCAQNDTACKQRAQRNLALAQQRLASLEAQAGENCEAAAKICEQKAALVDAIYTQIEESDLVISHQQSIETLSNSVINAIATLNSDHCRSQPSSLVCSTARYLLTSTNQRLDQERKAADFCGQRATTTGGYQNFVEETDTNNLSDASCAQIVDTYINSSSKITAVVQTQTEVEQLSQQAQNAMLILNSNQCLNLDLADPQVCDQAQADYELAMSQLEQINQNCQGQENTCRAINNIAGNTFEALSDRNAQLEEYRQAVTDYFFSLKTELSIAADQGNTTIQCLTQDVCFVFEPNNPDGRQITLEEATQEFGLEPSEVDELIGRSNYPDTADEPFDPSNPQHVSRYGTVHYENWLNDTNRGGVMPFFYDFSGSTSDKNLGSWSPPNYNNHGAFTNNEAGVAYLLSCNSSLNAETDVHVSELRYDNLAYQPCLYVPLAQTPPLQGYREARQAYDAGTITDSDWMAINLIIDRAREIQYAQSNYQFLSDRDQWTYQDALQYIIENDTELTDQQKNEFISYGTNFGGFSYETEDFNYLQQQQIDQVEQEYRDYLRELAIDTGCQGFDVVGCIAGHTLGYTFELTGFDTTAQFATNISRASDTFLTGTDQLLSGNIDGGLGNIGLGVLRGIDSTPIVGQFFDLETRGGFFVDFLADTGKSVYAVTLGRGEESQYLAQKGLVEFVGFVGGKKGLNTLNDSGIYYGNNSFSNVALTSLEFGVGASSDALLTLGSLQTLARGVALGSGGTVTTVQGALGVDATVIKGGNIFTSQGALGAAKGAFQSLGSIGFNYFAELGIEEQLLEPIGEKIGTSTLSLVLGDSGCIEGREANSCYSDRIGRLAGETIANSLPGGTFYELADPATNLSNALANHASTFTPTFKNNTLTQLTINTAQVVSNPFGTAKATTISTANTLTNLFNSKNQNITDTVQFDVGDGSFIYLPKTTLEDPNFDADTFRANLTALNKVKNGQSTSTPIIVYQIDPITNTQTPYIYGSNDLLIDPDTDIAYSSSQLGTNLYIPIDSQGNLATFNPTNIILTQTNNTATIPKSNIVNISQISNQNTLADHSTTYTLSPPEPTTGLQYVQDSDGTVIATRNTDGTLNTISGQVIPSSDTTFDPSTNTIAISDTLITTITGSNPSSQSTQTSSSPTDSLGTEPITTSDLIANGQVSPDVLANSDTPTSNVTDLIDNNQPQTNSNQTSQPTNNLADSETDSILPDIEPDNIIDTITDAIDQLNPFKPKDTGLADSSTNPSTQSQPTQNNSQTQVLVDTETETSNPIQDLVEGPTVTDTLLEGQLPQLDSGAIEDPSRLLTATTGEGQSADTGSQTQTDLQTDISQEDTSTPAQSQRQVANNLLNQTISNLDQAIQANGKINTTIPFVGRPAAKTILNDVVRRTRGIEDIQQHSSEFWDTEVGRNPNISSPNTDLVSGKGNFQYTTGLDTLPSQTLIIAADIANFFTQLDTPFDANITGNLNPDYNQPFIGKNDVTFLVINSDGSASIYQLSKFAIRTNTDGNVDIDSLTNQISQILAADPIKTVSKAAIDHLQTIYNNGKFKSRDLLTSDLMTPGNLFTKTLGLNQPLLDTETIDLLNQTDTSYLFSNDTIVPSKDGTYNTLGLAHHTTIVNGNNITQTFAHTYLDGDTALKSVFAPTLDLITSNSNTQIVPDNLAGQSTDTSTVINIPTTSDQLTDIKTNRIDPQRQALKDKHGLDGYTASRLSQDVVLVRALAAYFNVDVAHFLEAVNGDTSNISPSLNIHGTNNNTLQALLVTLNDRVAASQGQGAVAFMGSLGQRARNLLNFLGIFSIRQQQQYLNTGEIIMVSRSDASFPITFNTAQSNNYAKGLVIGVTQLANGSFKLAIDVGANASADLKAKALQLNQNPSLIVDLMSQELDLIDQALEIDTKSNPPLDQSELTDLTEIVDTILADTNLLDQTGLITASNLSEIDLITQNQAQIDTIQANLETMFPQASTDVIVATSHHLIDSFLDSVDTSQPNTQSQIRTRARNQYLTNLITLINQAKATGHQFVLFATGASLIHVGDDYVDYDLPFSPNSQTGKVETDIDLFTSEDGIRALAQMLTAQGFSEITDSNQPLTPGTFKVTRDILPLTPNADRRHLNIQIVLQDGQDVDVWDMDGQFTDTTQGGEKAEIDIALQQNLNQKTVEVTTPDGDIIGANIEYLNPYANSEFYRIVETKSILKEDLGIGKAKLRGTTLETIQDIISRGLELFSINRDTQDDTQK